MIRKLLVANRGEIARRIFRTCREMGIATVATYSEADRSAPFVAEADEAVLLGAAEAAASYLRIDAVVQAARRTGADAIHPGYGFLAENPALAEAVLDAGLLWIGPPPEAIATMGSKLESKRVVGDAGVPVLAGIDLTGADDTAMHRAGEEVGYPLLVKASAGGGGKGMRVVSSSADLTEAVAAARREAGSSFGDDTVFLEPYLEAPRHVEIQVFGDTHGTVVSLFERECSIQRRHQKIIEESPSPALTTELRASMGEAAVAAAAAVSYVGAGTVEFLLHDGGFSFLEMNTRLQVEHPVTEEVTGLDLVRLQLLVAAGRPLPAEALHPTMRGHAIEARLYAEDPRHDFLPVTGRLDRFRLASGSRGAARLRLEAGVTDGSPVSIHYDPMLAKVISWAETRQEAAALLATSLQRAEIHGLVTNRDLLVRILRHPEFLAGGTDTHFLRRHDPAALGEPLPSPEERRLAAAAAALAAQAERRTRASVQSSLPSGWRNSPSGLQRLDFSTEGGEVSVGYRLSGRGGPLLEVGGETLEDVRIEDCRPDGVVIEVAGLLRTFRVQRVGAVHHVDGPTGYTRLVELPRFPAPEEDEEQGSLRAPMPGKVIRLLVDDGDHVDEGQVLVVMEAMKMEHSLRAPHPGTVKAVRATEGDQVDAEQVLVVVEA